MLPKKRPFTKWSCVVGQNSRFMLSTTSNKVRKIIGQTLVRVPIYLECWLDKARVEIVAAWASVGVAHQQQTAIRLQFGFKIWAVWINQWDQFTFDVHQVYANSIFIQTESSMKGLLWFNWLVQLCAYKLSSYFLPLPCSLFYQTGTLHQATSGSRFLILVPVSKQTIYWSIHVFRVPLQCSILPPGTFSWTSYDSGSLCSYCWHWQIIDRDEYE